MSKPLKGVLVGIAGLAVGAAIVIAGFFVVAGLIGPDASAEGAAAKLNSWADTLQAARSCEELGFAAADLQDDVAGWMGDLLEIEEMHEGLLAADIRLMNHLDSIGSICQATPRSVALLQEYLQTVSDYIRSLPSGD